MGIAMRRLPERYGCSSQTHDPAAVPARGQGGSGAHAESLGGARLARRDTLRRPGSAPPKMGRRRSTAGTGANDADKHRSPGYDFRNFSVSACERAGKRASDPRSGLRPSASSASSATLGTFARPATPAPPEPLRLSGLATTPSPSDSGSRQLALGRVASPVPSCHGGARGGGQGEFWCPTPHADGAGSIVHAPAAVDAGGKESPTGRRATSLSVLECLDMLTDIQVNAMGCLLSRSLPVFVVTTQNRPLRASFRPFALARAPSHALASPLPVSNQQQAGQRRRSLPQPKREGHRRRHTLDSDAAFCDELQNEMARLFHTASTGVRAGGRSETPKSVHVSVVMPTVPLE